MPASCRTVAARRPILAFRYANNEQTMTATELKAIIVNRSRYRILISGRVPHKIFSQFAQITVECVLRTLLTDEARFPQRPGDAIGPKSGRNLHYGTRLMAP